jgi:predicted GH43/DUF377 family glycosyl hydrolase
LIFLCFVVVHFSFAVFFPDYHHRRLYCQASHPINLPLLIAIASNSGFRAGIMIVDLNKPDKILYRSRLPILEPVLKEEKTGIVQSVVFPTGIDRRDDLGAPSRFDSYYGMADNYIGVARLDIPDELVLP